MISELYRQLKGIAGKEFGEIVEDSEIINSYTGKTSQNTVMTEDRIMLLRVISPINRRRLCVGF